MNAEAMKRKVLGCLLGGIIGDAMGAPVEGWHYERIVAEKGYLDDFEGAGTDDSIIKTILCEALLEHGGHITCDEFAASFLNHPGDYNWFFIPVRNMYHKLQDNLDLPINVGYNNMASSSSAMSISPMGIVNACDPRTAAREAYEVAGLIHSGCCSFCRDGAAAMAAAVAEAFRPGATVQGVLEAACAYLHPKSAAVMLGRLAETQILARKAGSFEAFRAAYYDTVPLPHTISDSRETVPVALALFLLAHGDAVRTIEYGANFGRDADTIATMAGAVAGAFAGVDGIKPEWIRKVLDHNPRQMVLADEMTGLIQKRYGEKRALLAALDNI